MVAERVAGLDGGGEPVVAVVEDGKAMRAFVPGAVSELVCVVAGLTAEELRQLSGGGGDEVDGHGVGLLSEPGGAVLVRQADEEPRWIDAALGGEADQAAGELLALAGGDDEHRVVKLADQLLEVLRCLLVFGHADHLPGRTDHHRQYRLRNVVSGYPGYTFDMAKVLVSLDDRLVKRIDRKANAAGKSRSGYLAELAQRDLAKSAGPGENPAARAAMRKLDRLFAKAPAGDSTAAVREERDAR